MRQYGGRRPCHRGSQLQIALRAAEQLSEGDEVRFTSQDGAEAVYTVERTAQVSPEEPEALREGGCPLVLYTCTPGGKARVVVYCQRENAA